MGMVGLGSGLAFGVVSIGLSSQFLTDQDCNALVQEAINQSFINGTSIGLEYAIASITQEAIQCNTIPIEYANYSYNLVAIECLNLNTTEEK